MSQVVVREGETFDSLLRRFNKRVQMDGILSEARRRSHFEKPSVQRKRKAAAKRRKSARTTSTIGSPTNIKITTPQDIAFATALAAQEDGL